MSFSPLIEKKVLEFQKHLLYALPLFHENDFEHALEDFRKAVEAFMKIIIIERWGDKLGYEIVIGKSDTSGNDVDSSVHLGYASLFYVVQQNDLLNSTMINALRELQRCHVGAHNPNEPIDYRVEAEVCKPLIKNLSIFLHAKFSINEPELLSEAFEGRLNLEEIHKLLYSPWTDFYNATDRLSRTNRFILISPPTFDDCSLDQLRLLMLINWSFILDFNPESKETGLYKSFEGGKFKSISHLTIENRNKKNLLSNGSAGSVNWLFANGLKSLSNSITKNFSSWRTKRYHHFISEQLSEFASKATHQYIVIYLWDDWDYLEELIRSISDIESVSPDLFRHLVLSTDESVAKRLPELTRWVPDIEVIPLSWSSLVGHLQATVDEFENDETRYLVPGRTSSEEIAIVDISDMYNKLLDGHIEIIYKSIYLQKRPSDQSNIPPFLHGEEITWHDLNVNNAVERYRYNDLVNSISETLSKAKKSFKFELLHKPGAGGTVLGRKISFKLREVYPTILIKRYNTNTFELLSQFLSKVNKNVLAIVESAAVDQDDLESLIKTCNAKKLTVCFVYVKRVMGNAGQKNLLSFILEDTIVDRAEKMRFVSLVERHSKNAKDVKELEKSLPASCEVIDFSLAISEDLYNHTKLNDYIGAYINKMPDNQVQFTVFVAMAYYYSQKTVSHLIFRAMFKNGLPEELRHTKASEQYIRKLLLQEFDVRDQEYSEYWRPRFSKFAEGIMTNVLGRGGKDAWKDQIAAYALRFIEEFKRNNEFLVDESLQLLKGMFFSRENDESIMNSQNRSVGYSYNFSTLLRDIANKERQLEVLKALVDAYQTESHFKGQLARFIYENPVERKDFEEANALIDDALSSLDGDSDFNLHHFGGMSKRREVEFLHSSYRKKGESEIEQTELKEIADSGCAFFEASLQRNSSNIYAHVAIIQMLADVIDYGRELSGMDNRSSFLSSNRSAWYLEKYYTILENIETAKILIENQETLGDTSKLTISRNKVREGEGNVLGLIGDFDGSTGVYQSLLDSVERAFRPKMRVMVIQSLLLGKVKGERRNIKNAWKKLKDEEINRIQQLLNDNILQDPTNMVSFRLWFSFIRNTNVDISVDEAISKLRIWHDNAERSRFLQLEAAYYLYVLYASKIIRAGDSISLTDRTQCDFYLTRCSSLSINRYFAFEYLSVWEGIDSIINHKETRDLDNGDYRRVSGRITIINERQNGVIKLDCGLTAFFNPFVNGFLKGTNETDKVDFYVAFRHEGLVALDVKKSDSLTLSVPVATTIEKVDVIEPIEDIMETTVMEEVIEEEVDKNFIPTRRYTISGPKVLSKIVLDEKNNPSRKNRK
ncbi:hypothetical protein [Pedobacter sp. FW305-3-2-15-E-R2A2]|uniref:hypothetical protein n=1 Tax=Pedobacter sp. FW305-3-2-15-E-R2A2 TaxID=3140251 RepID=UPI0031401023